jgi:hypothetical protein
MVRIERHVLGPRVYVLGLRVHEFALGLGVLAVTAAGFAVEMWGMTRQVEAAALVGAWLVVKDRRDMFRSKRNTAPWSLLLHRVPRR